jgi:hypothetical protein
MKKLLKFIFPAILIAVSLFLCFKNYSGGTYLIGWDSLHPEFNFSIAFQRVVSGVWRSEQGVGAIAAHSHMADWTRIVFLFLESLFLPNSFLRYSYIFLCLILGPLGVYFFLDYVFENKGKLPAFLGALFYLLNLGTLQQFFVPFEMFPTQFAFLPWLILFALKVLKEGKKRNYLIFAVLTIISSPQAYAATLFYAYFGALCIFVLTYFLLNLSKNIFKRSLILVIITVFLNLYWILPNIYSVINQSQTIINAKINVLFSPEASYRNLGYEGLNNILIQKSFLFDWRAFDYTKNQFGDLMQVWNSHLNTFGVVPTLYLLSGLCILGAVLSLLRKNKIGIAVLAISIYSLFFLMGGAKGSEVLSEALRMPFTKFSIIFDFCLAFFFGYFFFRFISFVRPKFLKLFFGILLLVTVPSALIFTTVPMFNGGLISPIVRRNLPSEYIQLFDWFKNNSEGRVAVLPMINLWGWDYHSWNYEGSGFLTYGIKNPLLVRDFDRWSSDNEDFYTEASFALYANEPQNFINILQKYQVKYLILDESVINAGGETKKTLVSSPAISKEAQFGFLGVYKINVPEEEVSAPTYQTGSFMQSSSSADSGMVSSVKNPVVENLSQDRGQKSAVNCDLLKSGNVDKKVTDGVILYTASDGGVSCDYFDYPDIKYSQTFALRVAGENTFGRSLKIYLFNQATGQADLQELLPAGRFDKYYLINSKNITGAGYGLSLETRSFTGVPSVNLLTKIEIYPVKDPVLQGGYGFQNNLKILNIKKYDTWAYKVDVQGGGLMQLGQGFEKGWVAFSNFHLLEHTKVDSWANGWIVPRGTSTVYIFFWPQLLEFP